MQTKRFTGQSKAGNGIVRAVVVAEELHNDRADQPTNKRVRRFSENRNRRQRQKSAHCRRGLLMHSVHRKTRQFDTSPVPTQSVQRERDSGTWNSWRVENINAERATIRRDKGIMMTVPTNQPTLTRKTIVQRAILQVTNAALDKWDRLPASIASEVMASVIDILSDELNASNQAIANRKVSR